MKKSKIIIPALGILVLSTAASITGTVAWFSANSNVTVDGMKVHTSVSSNLLISDTYTDASFGAALDQGREAFLKPASTINGVNFFYTEASNVDAAGNVKQLNYIAYSEATEQAHALAGKTAYCADFQVKNGVETPYSTSNVAYAYVDYSFYLKATNSENEVADIRMTKCNLLYGSGTNEDPYAALAGDSAAGKAWRVAVFAKDLGSAPLEAATTDEVAAGNNKTILALSGAANFVAGNAAATAYTPTPYAAGTRGTVINPSTAAKTKTSLAVGATLYQKVTVRLWLEGEDTTCTNDTYAKLTKEWKLDLRFDLVKTSVAESGVTTIGSAVAA